MANQRNLINAFDDCIERLTAGENLDDVLKDYPDSADYLRDLLMIGERISEVHNEDDETTSAQSRGRDKLQHALKEKPKRKNHGRPFWYLPTVAAAIFTLIIGAGFLYWAVTPSYSPSFDATRTSIAVLNATTNTNIYETQVKATQYSQSTQVAYAMPTATPNASGIIITSAASMDEATAEPRLDLTGGPDFFPEVSTAQAQLDAQMTATRLSNLVDATQTSDNTLPSIYETGDPDFPAMTAQAESVLAMTATIYDNWNEPSATPTMIPMSPDYSVIMAEMTATALAELFAQSTPDAPSNGAGDNLPDTSGGGYGVNDAFKTTSVPELESTLPPTWIPTTTATTTPIPTQTVAPQRTQVADGSYAVPSQNNDAPTPLPALIPLNAGEIDDNEEWDTYLLYRREFMARNIPFYDIDVTGRQIIKVMDETGQPVLGARVRVYANQDQVAETLTYATGKTLFLPNADERSRGLNEFYVFVDKDGARQTFTLNRTQANTWDVTLPMRVNRDAVKLDVLFLMDTTSSMGDEIAQLQNNILHISDAVDGFANKIDVNYGLLLYREFENFEYVTRRHDFTSDGAEFQTYLNAVTANSGDNNPDWDETLNVGLEESLRLMSWRDEDTIKLIFIVADAAPHINHPLEPVTYDQSIRTALARGIKIHPIGSSGLEPQGEFIFRQIAQVTMGHFLFLTYDNGIAGTVGDVRPELDVGLPDSLNPIGGYTVDRLADVVLRLIQDEILTFRGIIQP
jgi:hypothetical protein